MADLLDQWLEQVAMLLTAADEGRAATCGHALGADVFVFALDVAGLTPWRPDSGATYRFDRLRRQVVLETVRLDDLRHLVATRLLDAGLPVRAVSERLAHANATTTLSIYAHSVPATDRQAADLMGDLLTVRRPKSD